MNELRQPFSSSSSSHTGLAEDDGIQSILLLNPGFPTLQELSSSSPSLSFLHSSMPSSLLMKSPADLVTMTQPTSNPALIGQFFLPLLSILIDLLPSHPSLTTLLYQYNMSTLIGACIDRIPSECITEHLLEALIQLVGLYD